MELTPRVSVIIPTHNRASMLREAIESVRGQTYRDWELIVVDDGSADHTKTMVADLIGQEARIRYIWKPQGGVSTARNAGIRAARGWYVAFLDDDDLLLPDWLAVQVEYLERHPEIGFVYGEVEILNKDGIVTAIEPERPITSFVELFERGGIRIQSVLCRTDIVQRLGGFDEQLTISEDYDLWLRLAAVTRFGFVPRPVVRYRVHGANACNDGIRIYRERAIALKKVTLDHSRGITFWRKQRRIGINEYRLARLYRDQAKYVDAARHFWLAVLSYPLVGVEMAEPTPRGWRRFWFLVKPLLAILACTKRGTVLFARSPKREKIGDGSIFPEVRT